MSTGKAPSYERDMYDSIRSFGYDWSVLSDRAIAPKFPFKVYLPRSIEDVEQAARETAQLGQRLRVRGSGHSSNDLVLEERGAILSTAFLNNVLSVDPEKKTVTAEPGATLEKVDNYLRPHGFGLPILGDHHRITVGGFASVGGCSPASHLYGCFVDNVKSIEVVEWNGQRRTYDRENHAPQLKRVLGGTGRFGVIARLTLDIIPGDKWTAIVRNRRFFTRDREKFIEYSRSVMENPGAAALQRGLWLEYPFLGRNWRIGQFSAYEPVEASTFVHWGQAFINGIFHFFGACATRLPSFLGRLCGGIAALGLILSPRYSSIKNVEILTDKTINHAVGDPPRLITALAPVNSYKALFQDLHEICARYRDRHRVLSFLSFYVVGIRSAWMTGGSGEPLADLVLYVGVRPGRMTADRFDALIGEIDGACLKHGAFRYMHSKTSKDPAIRKRLDPNERYAAALETPSAEPAPAA